MSLLTDTIDTPGNVEVRLAGPSGVVATDAGDLARAVVVLREKRDLAAAVAAGLEGATDLLLVGFSPTTAEPFALGPGPAATVLAGAADLIAGRAYEGERDPLWAGHRGHAVWLHPASVDSARLFLALRLAEAIDPARKLASPASLLATAATAITEASGLDAALETDRFEALVPVADVESEAPVAKDVGRTRSIVVFDGVGGAIVASASSLPLPIGLVDRGNRPYLLPLRPASPGAFLELVHRAIDLDQADALATVGGARLEPGGDPELAGYGELVPATRD